MTKKFIIWLVNLGVDLVSKKEITGLENVSFDQPSLVTANHIGRLDAFMILSVKDFAIHPNLLVFVAEKYGKYGIIRWAVKELAWTFLDRFNADVKALRTILRRLRNNGLMIIAPEGTRSKSGKLLEGKSGAAYLAAKTKATIIPLSIIGSDDQTLVKNLKRLRRSQVTITIGKPYTLPDYPKSEQDDFIQMASDEIMCQIAALHPPELRGHYENHPRLLEIINESSKP